MIARVKVSPTQRWCKKHAANPKIAGHSFEILSHTCQDFAPTGQEDDEHPKGVRWWCVPEEFAKQWMQEFGLNDNGGRWVCEHMLEMD